MSELPGRAFCSAFARREVTALADRRSFERGLLYATSGRVGKRTVTASSAAATVRGSASYQVRLWLEGAAPAYDCSCPVGQEGGFCKHTVAVALVATGSVPDLDQQVEAVIDVRGYLEGVDHHALVDLLVEHAAVDDIFDARLRMDAARATAGPLQVGVFRHAIYEAFLVDGYVDYRDMYDYVTAVNSVLDSLQELLEQGHAEAVISLADHAIDRAEDALGYVDDSDGWMSGIAERLHELHHDACEVAKPDPVMLARTLYERERHAGDLDVFSGAAAAYADLLGADGLAEYRGLAWAEWDALPALGPEDEERSWSARRFRITTIMQTLAELTGDVDAVVDVLARDQSSAYQFVRIVEVLRDAQRHDDALSWAERGLVLHGGADSRLVEAAAEEYHRAGRGADAVRVAWDAYDQEPALRTYRQLAEQAERADLWTVWHGKALDLLRTRISRPSRKPATGRATGWPALGPDGSTLVEVLLFDGDVEAAWTEAGSLGCRRDLWLELARRREGEHPLDAIPIWQAEIERRIDAKNNQAYTEAVKLIERVGRLMAAADRVPDFGPYVAKVRANHKPKRNLMKLFDSRGW